MKLGYIGINYKNAKLDIRDKTSFTDNMKIEFMQEAEKLGIEQCMVLSTCNRSEVYFMFREAGQFEQMENLYRNMFPQVSLDEFLLKLMGREAISYLFRIAAGLESLVLGEDQILGQVKDAMDLSRTLGYSKKELTKVVRDAVTCAKKIKTELKISEKPISVSYVGIRQLEEKCGIMGKSVLVIGSGKTSTLALTYLYEYGAAEVFVCSRTLAHARDLMEKFPEFQVIDYENRYLVMESCDIVISATASPHLVIIKDRIKAVEKQITFLDLAAPRDIDTEVEEIPGMQLINLDTLQKIVSENQKERERLIEISRGMIDEAVSETEEWLLSARVDSTIESLQQRCDEIVEDSFDYLNRKIELSTREQKILKKILNASLHRLLREPIQELKQLDSKEKQDEYQKVVRDLFQI
ncbi:MAG: glutamyl-tRNA reductase [Lachnospiraceae bacterium]|nr:glutamyl-tRNA reductase [Lachnospiraceae bacterium]